MLTRARIVLGLSALGVAVAASAIFACGAQGFDPQSKVDSVRIFAVRADKPYAKPGDTVNLEALLTDGRRDKVRPLKLYWIPVVCLNPRSDLYYLCFVPPPADGGVVDGGAQFVPAPQTDGGLAAADAGAFTGGALGNIPTGIDLAPFLPQGPTFSFQMPTNVVQPREGTEPYGLAYIFNIACAGKVMLAERDSAGGPQQVPIQCTDDDGVKLSPADYVIGISRVYAFENETNNNPVIERVTLDGVDVDLAAGITVDHCTADRRQDCKEYKIDVKVPESSWEINPDISGNVRHEQIWAAYYADLGDLQDDARLLYDTTLGRISESDETFRAPGNPMDGTIWAVVHDNRGGAAWVTIPVHVK